MSSLTKNTLLLTILFTCSNCSTSMRAPSGQESEFPNCEVTSKVSKDSERYFKNSQSASEDNYQDLCEIPVLDLHPTQFSVGYLEVKRKVKKIEDMSSRELRDYQQENPEPIIIGPRGEFFIIDHHHLGRALYEAKIPSTYGIILENWYKENENAFWAHMKKNGWVYLVDEKGENQTVNDLLKVTTVKDLKDDPYRSLAGKTRCDDKKKSACKNDEWFKEPIPFIEFKWAEHFRETPSIAKEIEKDDFEDALEASIEEIKRLGGQLPRN